MILSTPGSLGRSSMNASHKWLTRKLPNHSSKGNPCYLLIRPGPSREINLCRKQLMRMTLDMTQGNTYALKRIYHLVKTRSWHEKDTSHLSFKHMGSELQFRSETISEVLNMSHKGIIRECLIWTEGDLAELKCTDSIISGQILLWYITYVQRL